MSSSHQYERKESKDSLVTKENNKKLLQLFLHNKNNFIELLSGLRQLSQDEVNAISNATSLNIEVKNENYILVTTRSYTKIIGGDIEWDIRRIILDK